MSLMRHIKRLQFIDFLVRRKATGTPDIFAMKSKLSKSGLMQVLREMKEMGFPIRYCRVSGNYYYEKEGQMVACLFMENGQILSKEDLRQISVENINSLCFSDTVVFERCVIK